MSAPLFDCSDVQIIAIRTTHSMFNHNRFFSLNVLIFELVASFVSGYENLASSEVPYLLY